MRHGRRRGFSLLRHITGEGRRRVEEVLARGVSRSVEVTFRTPTQRSYSMMAAPLQALNGAAAEGAVGDNRLKLAEPLEGSPALPQKLCDFIDWVADYTLNPPGAILAMALRSRGAFEPEARRTAYVRGSVIPPRMSAARTRTLDVAGDGLARSVSGLAEDANVSAGVVRSLIQAGALVPTELPEFSPFAAPDPEFDATILNPDQQAAADELREQAGKKLDPVVVQAFLTVLQDDGPQPAMLATMGPGHR